MAGEDKEVKAILLHGGKYFSSGNDLSVFTEVPETEEEFAKWRKIGEESMAKNVSMILAM